MKAALLHQIEPFYIWQQDSNLQLEHVFSPTYPRTTKRAAKVGVCECVFRVLIAVPHLLIKFLA